MASVAATTGSSSVSANPFDVTPAQYGSMFLAYVCCMGSNFDNPAGGHRDITAAGSSVCLSNAQNIADATTGVIAADELGGGINDHAFAIGSLIAPSSGVPVAVSGIFSHFAGKRSDYIYLEYKPTLWKPAPVTPGAGCLNCRNIQQTQKNNLASG